MVIEAFEGIVLQDVSKAATEDSEELFEIFLRVIQSVKYQRKVMTNAHHM